MVDLDELERLLELATLHPTGAAMKEQSDMPRTDAAKDQMVRVPMKFINKIERERDEARAEVERLRSALRGLHDDIVEYQRINHLGGYDNHWMRAAREALAATEAKP